MTKETRVVVYREHAGIKKFAYRPDSYDKAIFGEFKAYQRMALRKTDVLLDVGAHIGIYSAWAAPLVKRVIAVEPEATNIKLLQHNLHTLKNVTILPLALIGANDERKVVTFFVQGANTVGHSIHHFRGRGSVEVTARSATQLMLKEKVTVIKLDCEGAEYPIILDAPFPPLVRAVVMEMHFGKQSFRDWSKEAHKAMLKQKFKAVHAPNLENRGLWHTNALYER